MAPDQFKNIDEAVKKLCVEAVKVEKELKEAEGEASLKKKCIVTTQLKNQELKGEIVYLESQKCKADHDSKTLEEDIAYLVQRLGALATCLVTLQLDQKFIKNSSTNNENIKATVVQRMKEWKLSVDQGHGCTAEEKTLVAAQQKVASLKHKRDALLSMPEKVSVLQKSLDDHLMNKEFLKKEVAMLQEYQVKKEQPLSHIRQEVLVYEQRNQDHASRLKREIDEVSAYNSWLSLELSRVEGKVTQLRDQMEG